MNIIYLVLKQSFVLLLHKKYLFLSFFSCTLCITRMSEWKRKRGGKPKQPRKILHKPVAVDTAFLPWLPGLGPAFPRDSAGGREGRRTARGRGCSAVPESEGYCPCRTAAASSSPSDPSDCPGGKHKQRNISDVQRKRSESSCSLRANYTCVFSTFYTSNIDLTYKLAKYHSLGFLIN